MTRWMAGLLVCALLTVAAAPTGPPEDNPFADLADDGAPGATQQPAQPAEVRRAVVIVLDASGSMRADDGNGSTRIATAKAVVQEVLETLPGGMAAGLRVFGHRVPPADQAAACEDIELVLPVGEADPAAITAAMERIRPLGYTPISQSLRQAADDLPAAPDRSLVLISDGIHTCGPPDPCDVARDLAAEDPDRPINTVGFRVDDDARAQLQCVAEVTGGSYFDADDELDLFAAFRFYEVQGQPVRGGDTPSAAVLLEPGQYVDSVEPGQERWYEVRLDAGEVLRAAGTLVLPPGVPRDPGARFAMELRAGDVLGTLRCDRDATTGVGVGLTHTAVRWDGEPSAGGLCSDHGSRLLRVALDGSARGPADPPGPLEGQTLGIELLVDVRPAAEAVGA